jgi:hypothetical protein
MKDMEENGRGCFKVRLRYLPRGTEENDEKP